jgi:outer membrane protein assembly factor BamB
MLQKRMSICGLAIALGVCLAVFSAAETEQAVRAQKAGQILKATGVKGGLVVHVGCGDGKLTAALRVGESYRVHGLDANAANIKKAIKHISSLGLYGKVSVERWTNARLPYTDNLANLFVSEDLGNISMEEVMRVLVPNGVAYIKDSGKWIKTVKPWPKDIDEWTHFLHDADNNAVAKDTAVGPPRHIQWVGKPRWMRSHDHLASMSVLVSAGGRVFYIIDEGSTASINLTPKWFLVARDAFNGVILWKRPIASWFQHLIRFQTDPVQLQRRLIAVGNRVYVTLGLHAPLTAVDAATGEIIRTYEKTDYTEEIIYSEGILILVVKEIAAKRKFIMAVKSDTGELLWKKSGPNTAKLMPLTLAAQGKRVFFQNRKAVFCLDLKTGRELWQSSRLASPGDPRWGWAPALFFVVHDGVVFCSDVADSRRLVALSAKTGKTLWSRNVHNKGPRDIFVANKLVWMGESYPGKKQSGKGGWGTHVILGCDPATGKVKKRITIDAVHHHRCYRNKATDRYILAGRRGVEFIDLKSGEVRLHHWVRGTCRYGIMPCNGLLYAPPHACFCYIAVKLSGFYALAPEKNIKQQMPNSLDDKRLEYGSVYKEVINKQLSIVNSDDWPMYRHDAARSGTTKSIVSAVIRRAWQVDFGGRISSPVISNGKVFVASVNAHTVHALNAKAGKLIWSYTVGGRVDTPPTIYKGLVIFGSADGWVYCLRISDGKLVWRFQGAPEERRVMAFGQLESVWPIHGSVLLQDNVIYFAAGRSSYLDGGIYLYRLDPKTGKKLSETRIYSLNPKTGKQPKIDGFNVSGLLPDILSSDGTSVYMRHMKFDRYGARQKGTGLHLFAPTGFLDDSWFHRSRWIFGTQLPSFFKGLRAKDSISGRIIVFDKSAIYTFGGRRRLSKKIRPKYNAPWGKGKYIEFSVRAMVLADKILFVAGEKKGGALWAVLSSDGKKLAEYKLEAPPIFDGMAAADGRLYIALQNGQLVCMGKNN